MIPTFSFNHIIHHPSNDHITGRRIFKPKFMHNELKRGKKYLFSNEGHENSPPWKMIPPLKMENDPPFHFSKNNIGK